MAQNNATTARRLYQDWNKRDFDHLAGLYGRNCEIMIVGSGTRFEGLEGAKEYARMWADGFPDGQIKVALASSGSGTRVSAAREGSGSDA